jgi:DNA-binding PadR family transcriptional regulator
MTIQTLALVAPMLDDPTHLWYGLELAAAADLKSGTIYPILARLEKAGWLISRWEDVNPSEAGRPRRRLYELTGHGREMAREALERVSVLTKAKPTARRRLLPGAQPV